MSTSLAILCPGQGGQHAAMFDILRASPSVAAILNAWSLETKLGKPLTHLLDGDLLFSNAVAQPLIVAATLAAWEGIRNAVPEPALVAGYSVGEVSACAVAGALDSERAVDLALERARLMNRCVQDKPQQALIAVSGLGHRIADALFSTLPLHLAIDNGDGHFVAGCLVDDLPHVMVAMQAAGGRIQRLPVALASHTPLLVEAVPLFSRLLGDFALIDPSVPLISGIAAEPLTRKGALAEHLARQLAEPIRWAGCMDVIAEAGIGVALELGPGAALARMLQQRHPHIACRSIADFRSLEGAAAWVERMRQIS